MSSTEKGEWLIILLAALALIPFAFHYRATWYKAALVVVAAVMVWIFVQRFRRLR